MNDYLENLFDSIDAAIFSGDSFYNTKSLNRLVYYLDRWNKQIPSIKGIIKVIEEEVENEKI